jgi:hypothetical protein
MNNIELVGHGYEGYHPDHSQCEKGNACESIFKGAATYRF